MPRHYIDDTSPLYTTLFLILWNILLSRVYTLFNSVESCDITKFVQVCVPNEDLKKKDYF